MGRPLLKVESVSQNGSVFKTNFKSQTSTRQPAPPLAGQAPRTSHSAPRTPNPEPRTSLPIMESFYSLQGEGFHSGKAAYFIRLGGCDVGCHWCDVKESWDASAHPLKSVEELVKMARVYDPAFTVITGGEPLMYDLNILTSELRSQGLRTHLETSGAYPMTGQWDWICFSPKKFKKPQDEVYAVADELKVIIFNSSDLAWAERHAAKTNENCKLYLQPEWSRVDKNLPLLVDYVKANPQWKISMQTHKYLNLP